ncbi:hypothetical protein EYC84_011597 [Monilinia fructicola]|uniref:Uncharacterized protein n=1 Tax=Monilinia fructicola TaxID=38448 RepID=A0A5M9J9Z9_MONFR|nr:hypothetical protein EYC84_011597 [Monilinia fructicola]
MRFNMRFLLVSTLAPSFFTLPMSSPTVLQHSPGSNHLRYPIPDPILNLVPYTPSSIPKNHIYQYLNLPS